MDLTSIGQEQLALVAIPALLAVAALIWLLRRRTPREVEREHGHFSYVIYSRAIPLGRRIRLGRLLIVGTGSYGVGQGARTPLGLTDYSVLDELALDSLIDFDTQQARRAVDTLPPEVGVVSVFPDRRQYADGHQVEQGSEMGIGLRKRSLAEVDGIRQLWEPPLDDFLKQVDLELQRGGIPAPPVVLAYISPGGHGLVGVETARWLRRRYPTSAIYGVTIVPLDSGNRPEFADLLERLCPDAEHDLDALIITDNRLPDYLRHDDMLTHMVGIAFQGARERGANPANVFTEATVPGRTPTRRTRLLTIEYAQTEAAVLEPEEPGLLGRLLGRRGRADTNPVVLVQRGDELAGAVATGDGTLAGPLPLAPTTRTAVFLGLPHNGSAAFPKIAAEVKRRFDARQIDDPDRLQFMIGQFYVPTIAPDQGAPVVAIRLGEMAVTPKELIDHFRVRSAAAASEVAAELDGHRSDLSAALIRGAAKGG